MEHDLNIYLSLLKMDGTMTLVGAPGGEVPLCDRHGFAEDLRDSSGDKYGSQKIVEVQASFSNFSAALGSRIRRVF